LYKFVYICINLYTFVYICIHLYTSVYICIHLYTFVKNTIVLYTIHFVCIVYFTIQNCMVYAHNCNNVDFCTDVHTLYTKSTYIIYHFWINIQNVCILIQYIQKCRKYPYILTIFLQSVILQPFFLYETLRQNESAIHALFLL
jgi:hypothetical protein